MYTIGNNGHTARLQYATITRHITDLVYSRPFLAIVATTTFIQKNTTYKKINFISTYLSQPVTIPLRVRVDNLSVRDTILLYFKPQE